VPVKFTEGFNPHPKLSLPLPRPVGVASDDELLALRLFDEDGIPAVEGDEAARERWERRLGESLSGALPDAIEVRSVTLAKSNASFVAESADYQFPLRPNQDRREHIASLLARESIVLDRTAPNRRERRVDVRGFLKSLIQEDDLVVAGCAITAGGSIRVDEILGLLDLTAADLAGPVRRANVRWASR
jgi:radical SAM-linked protein